jgi:hypothetical protein
MGWGSSSKDKGKIMTISAVLLAHFPERKDHIEKIVKDLQAGSRKPDEIIIFVDDPAFDLSGLSGVRILSADSAFPVTSRMHAASFATSSHVFLMDCDQTVEEETLEHMAEYSEKHPFSVLGFEGSRLSDTENPYTDGLTLNKSPEKVMADMVIRSWFLPKTIIGLSIFMHEIDRKDLKDKYNDDILICMSNRLLQHHSNWIIPHLPKKGLVELGDGGVGQSLTSGHYPTRNQNCRFLIDKYQNQFDIFRKVDDKTN